MSSYLWIDIMRHVLGLVDSTTHEMGSHLLGVLHVLHLREVHVVMLVLGRNLLAHVRGHHGHHLCVVWLGRLVVGRVSCGQTNQLSIIEDPFV